MGDELITTPLHLPPWLDPATAALTDDIVRTLMAYRRDLLAIILYGSVARHDERPVDDTHPSDVDLLAIFGTDDEQFAVREGKAIFGILGQAYDRHLGTLRDVKVMFATRVLSEWDTTFIANIAQDGVLLWAREPLPDALAAIAGRTFVASDRVETDVQTDAG